MYEQYPISRFDYDVCDYIILFPLPHLVSAIALDIRNANHRCRLIIFRKHSASTNNFLPIKKKDRNSVSKLVMKEYHERRREKREEKLYRATRRKKKRRRRGRRKIVLSRSKFNLFVKTGNDRQAR